MARVPINKCEFCVSMVAHQNARRVLTRIDESVGEEPMHEQYKAALVILTYKKGHKKEAARTVDFKKNGKGFDLFYCPECGRPLHLETGG